MAQVRLEDVQKVYPNGYEAVKGVSLAIGDGEFVVLVGPSGCGKSTTLRMVAGLEEISGGTISIGDRVVNDVHPKDRDIAMVFQNYALYPHMSVYENMAFALKLRKFPKADIQRRVGDAAKILGITDLLERKPKVLSGGQRQRVAVGRAIVREPKAFLFDEPLSNLDAKLRVTTRAELKALHMRLKTTTIYVTHDQEEAMTLGDRIVVMQGGVIQQADTPLEVYRRPVNRFVASFVGTPPMNFFEGRLVKQGDGLAFAEGSGSGATASPTGGGLPFAIKLGAERAKALANYADKLVVLGLRPQGLKAVMATSEAMSSAPVIELTVRVIEPLGDLMDVSCSSALHPHVVARVAAPAFGGSDLAVGRATKFEVDLEYAHVFEPGDLGRRLA